MPMFSRERLDDRSIFPGKKRARALAKTSSVEDNATRDVTIQDPRPRLSAIPLQRATKRNRIPRFRWR
jgi:hypothetical protein